MISKKRIPVIALLCCSFLFLMSSYAFAVTQIYPTDYEECFMPYHDYQPDDFCYASNTPYSQAIRDFQTQYAKKIFQQSFGTSANPRYSNMWGTYSSSRQTAHEGLDMIYGTTGQPISHWGSDGTVTIVEPGSGLVGIYCSSINKTIFYRHMNSISSAIRVGVQVNHGQPIGTMGARGDVTGPHLHTGVEIGNTAIDAAEERGETAFTSDDPYIAMLYLGY